MPDLQYLVDMLVPIINSTKQRRRWIEAEWLLNYRAWQGWPTQQYAIPLPDGGIHYFIPHARKEIEKNVKRMVKLATGGQERFQTTPRDGISHAHSEAAHAVMQFVYDEKIATRRLIATSARCLQLYNFCCINTSVQIENDYVWPYQETKDPFNFYVFPDTALNRQEALVIFEECIIPYQVYKSYSDAPYSFYEKIKVDQLVTPEWPYHLIERLAYRGLTQPSDFSQGSNAPVKTEEELKEYYKKTKDSLSKQSRAFVCLVPTYFKLGSTWYFTVILMNTSAPKIVRLDEAENQPLYRWTNARALPGELYTNAPMDDIRTLQTLTNNALSQVEANRQRVAEPPLAADANEIGRFEEYTFAGRKLWKMPGNPKDLIQAIQVGDTTKTGLTHWQIYLNMLKDGSGGGLAEGTPGRNMPRAGGMSQLLFAASMLEVEDVAKTQEDELLTPGLGDTFHIILEYVPDNQLIEIPAKNIELIKQYYKRDIKGNYTFKWLGALSVTDEYARGEKYLQFLTLLLNPNVLQILLPQLQQKQLTIDFATAIQSAYTFILGERGLNNLIIPMTPQQIQAANQPDPRLILEQQKMQQEAAKTQLEVASKQAELQGKGIDLQSKQLDARGKIIDIQGKQLDLEGKKVELRAKVLGSFRGEEDA